MRRAAMEKGICERRRKLWANQSDCLNPLGRDPKPAGRYRKMRPFDCGKPRCVICHGHKRNGHEATRQEIVSEMELQEK